MKFDEIITIAGKPGLFKIIKASKNGYIVEELEGKGKKLALGAHHRVSFLKEISMYTTTGEGSVPIQELYEKLQKEPSLMPEGDLKSEEVLFSALGEILPDFDSERIYLSDLKKFYSWFNTLVGLDETMDFSSEEESEKKE